MLGTRSGIKRQNRIESRKDVLVYSTAPLKSPIEVTGPIRAILYVSTGVTSTDFTAKLVDVHPDGSAYNLSDGILRRKYRPARLAKDERPETPTEIEIELWPTSNLFLVGHQIRLEISSSNFPRYDRNPNTGELIARATKTIPATQKIFHLVDFPSQLILPVIPRN